MAEKLSENRGNEINMHQLRYNSRPASVNNSQNSTINYETMETEVNYHKEDIHAQEMEEEQEGYPAVLESAPFPALGSLEEITQTLSRIKSNQTQRSSINNLKVKDASMLDQKGAMAEDGELDGKTNTTVPFKQTPYYTDGIRNPGWLTVISCFLVNFFVFGTTFAWGNYQKLYIDQIYAGQTDVLRIAFVGTSASALLLALGMFITPVIQKLGFRGTMAIGTILSPLGLILASFATQLWHVYLSQGILFGLGAAFVFSPSVTLPSQWFTSRRALATGIAVSGSGIGGVCMSPMSQNLIQKIGYRNALRVQGSFGFVLLCIATALAVCRYRPPPSADGKNKWYHVFDKRLISRKFTLLLCFGFLVPFGYVAPFFLAPQFAQHIGLDTASGAAMISVMSAANAVCRISLGYLADRIGRFNTMFACTFLSGFFTMVVWQFAGNYPTFAVYCVLFGLTAGGFVSLLPVTTADIVGVENIQRGLGMAYMTTVIGNLVGTPIIGLLFNTYSWTAAIQFTGSLTVAASFFILAIRMMVAKGKLFVCV